ncbi:MAG: metallophosphoesterase [Lachnospiraceae bacterium]|nr:metallophosphoesterase [Lachnospiraceae bacterium]
MIVMILPAVIHAGCAKSGTGKAADMGVNDPAVSEGSVSEMVEISEDEAVRAEAVSDDDVSLPESNGDEVPQERERRKLSREERARIQDEKQINIYEKTIEIDGLERDADILFIADMHISLCDDRDMDVYDKAVYRYGNMLDANGRPAYQTFHEFVDYANTEDPDLFILGGDILDSAMMASVNFLEQELSTLDVPYMYMLGNHDFEYGNEYFSKKAYEEYRPRVVEVSGSENGAHLFDVAGIHIFAADDANSQFTPEELEEFKKVYSDGKPVLFIGHVPFEPEMGDTSLYDKSVELFGTDSNGNSRALIGEHSVVPNETTKEMRDLILADDSPVFCVLSGHIHYPHEDQLAPDVTQIVAGAAYRSRGVLLHLRRPEE